ncbi:unnamed protein product [Orchesella dallaii]|uniref:Uncharacterized protein n=1 Tax=Orchesella dallaii TaxID=48710 RepID=A0ABP1SB45_9HEXA
MSLLDVGFKTPSYKVTDDFLKRMASVSSSPFHPIPARHLVSRYMVNEVEDFNFNIPQGTSRYVALLDNNPHTFMIQTVQRFFQDHCNPGLMNDFRIVNMPTFFNPLLKGSPILAALGLFNYVHENTLSRSIEGRFPSEYELYQMGLTVFPTSFRRMHDQRIIGNLSTEVPEALGQINHSMWERFGHPAARNVELEAPEHEDRPAVIPFHEAFPDWVLEEDVQEDGDQGYDYGFESDDTVENEPQVIRRLRLCDRERLVWALLHN